MKNVKFKLIAILTILICLAISPFFISKIKNDLNQKDIMIGVNIENILDERGEFAGQYLLLENKKSFNVIVEFNDIDKYKEQIKVLKNDGSNLFVKYSIDNNVDMVINYMKQNSVSGIIFENIKNINKENELKIKTLKDIIKSKSIVVVLKENRQQNGVNISRDIANNIVWGNKVLKSYEYINLFPDEKDNSNKENLNYENIYYAWINSTIDRNVRFIEINNGKLEENIKYANKYIEKIELNGYKVTNSINDINVMENAIRNEKQLNNIGYVIAIFVSVVASYVIHLVLLNIKNAREANKKEENEKDKKEDKIKKVKDNNIFGVYIKSINIILIGALIVLFILSIIGDNISYRLGITILPLVPITFVLPIILGILSYYNIFIKENNEKKLRRLDKTKIIIILICFIIIISILLLRNMNMPITNFERMIRNALVDIFTVRPRFKEFAIGYPSLGIFIYMILNKRKEVNNNYLEMVSVLGMIILISSIFNTTYHLYTSFLTTYLRIVYGLMLGTSICVILIISIIIKNKIKGLK